MSIRDKLDQVAEQRPAIPGDPSAGPFPATVDEVADEVVAWVREMDRTSARGLAAAVFVRLNSGGSWTS